MSVIVAQSDRPGWLADVTERCRRLGVSVLLLDRDGAVVEGEPLRPVERMLVGSPMFAEAVRRAWPALSGAGDEPVSLWPGLEAIAVPSGRPRRSEAEAPPQLHVALLPGRELVESEQFRHACDRLQRDYEATRAEVEREGLMGSAEARRVAQCLSWMCQDVSARGRQAEELLSLSRELSGTYEELSLLYKLSASMNLNQAPARFLGEAVRELCEVVGLRWLALQLVEGERRLDALAGELFVAGPVRDQRAALKTIGLALLDEAAEHTDERPMIVDDTSAVGIEPLPRLASNLLSVPLRVEGRALAVLFGGDKLDADQITMVDYKLCDSLANSLTIFLENLMLYEDVNAMFLGTLHALTSAIDAKDSYTHGHSERVALMSRLLAEAAGLDAQTCERVYLAGLVHDVGKIGVPEAVLCKPGKLTEDEFAQIKRHPEIGARILQDIRQMDDLIPGVLYHHERYDGRGYPEGLAGDAIPLFGRLIGLADAFDAMSSNRTYRQAMPLPLVLEEIRRFAGKQFDPQLADLFVTLDFEPFQEALERHQGIRLKRSA